jgi:hypothetical protein
LTEALFLLGIIRFISDSGKFVQTSLMNLSYSSKLTSTFQAFFLGLFLFLFSNFLFLKYLTAHLNLPWIAAVKCFGIFYSVVYLGFQFLRVRSISQKIQTFKKSLAQITNAEKTLFFVGIIMLALVSLLYVYENDALEYFGISRQIIADNSLENYPPTVSDWEDSLYAPSTHPPYFHIFMSLFAPSIGSWIGLRLILLLMSLGMVLVLLRRDQYVMGFLVALSLPILIFGIQGLSIESFRLPFFASGLILILKQSADERFIRDFLRNTLGLAMMISTHSLGLLMSSLTIAACFIVLRNFRTLTIQICGLIFSIACVAPQYISNTIQFGSPVQDSSPILDLPQIAFYDDLRTRRQISTFNDMLINGSMRPLIDFSLFGFVFAVGVLLSLRFVWKNPSSLDQNPLLSVSALIVLLFVFLQMTSSLLGVELLVKNVRYALSIFPCLLVVILEHLKPRNHE